MASRPPQFPGPRNVDLEYPKGLGNAEYPHYIIFTQRRSYSTKSTLRGSRGSSVALYMTPDALKTSYSQTYGDVDMGGAIELAMSDANLAGAGEQLATGDISGIKSILGNVGLSDAGSAVLDTLIAETTKTVVEAGGSKIGATKQAIERASGRILNPHKAVIYQGPGGFRTFSYSFSMIPKNPDEAEQIKGIVKFFKEKMHPSVGGTGGDINSISSHTLTYPDEFEIKYFVNGEENDSLFKIKPCFLQSVSVDHNTSGLPVFIKDGEPQTTAISLSFKETQLITRSDIEEGF